MKVKTMFQSACSVVMALAMVMAFARCSGDDTDEDVIDSNNTTSSSASSTPDDDSDLVSNYSFTNTVKIAMGATSTVTNSIDGVTASVSGGDVTITSTADNVRYEVSGTTSNGSLKIYSDNKFQLALNGTSITNNDGAAINIQSKKRIFVELVDGTSNTLTDGSSYTTSDDEDMKGCLFSEGQLIFNGNGSLKVKSNYKHGICSDDYIRIFEGNIAITSTTDGIHANDAFVMDGGTVNIQSSSDGIECDEGYILINDGSLTVNCADDGITTSYEGTDSDPYIIINGGEIGITTTGASGKGIKSLGNLTINAGTISVKTNASEAEGIESKNTLTINGGTIEVNAVDDGINAAKYLEINDGKVYVYSTTNDAIDSNGTMTFNGGTIIGSGASQPEDAFDCDNNTFLINGGTIVGMGGGTTSPSTSGKQPTILYGGSGSQNTLVSLSASDGSLILAWTLPRTLQSMTLFISSPSISSGSSYTLASGGTISGGTAFHGLYTSGTLSGASTLQSVSVSSMVTTVGNVSTGMGGGGGMGGRP